MRPETAQQLTIKTTESPIAKVGQGEGAQEPSVAVNTVKKPEITEACAPVAQAGTALANLDITIGCAHSPRVPPFAKHGGARNSASRTSDYLTPKKVLDLISAANAARIIGRHLNRHMTVHWEAAGVPDSRAMAATTAFLKSLREWLGGETAYLWTRENGDGKGSHVHILAHLPAGRRWHGARGRRWIERISGKPYAAGVIKTRSIGGAGEPGGELYAANLAAVLAYALKGVEPDAAAAMAIEHEAGGLIIGKRCGRSRNIGPDV